MLLLICYIPGRSRTTATLYIVMAQMVMACIVTAPREGIDPPECLVGPWSRDNHLGNTHGGYEAFYNWTVITNML